MRTIAVVTVGRSDFGIYLPVLRAIEADPQLRLHLIVTGAHLSATYGNTVDEIVKQGFEIGDRVEMLLAGDSPESIAKSMGMGTVCLAQVYAKLRPDMLLILGDRFEMHAATVAAIPFRIPIAHIHGGEITQGAIDDCLRHALTKYSHLHFASTEEHAQRIIQLGEEPWRVTVSGAPSLDNLKVMPRLSKPDVERRLNMSLDRPPLLVTFHPVTLEYDQTGRQIEQVVSALSKFDCPIVITKPNADTANQTIIAVWNEFAKRHPNVNLVDNLGTQAYFSLMTYGAAMVGNSSSGIIEAASFELPVVNIGIRQEGRPRSGNVIDVETRSADIEAAIRLATSTEFRAKLRGLKNIYGDGTASQRIVDRLRDVSLDGLIVKRFHDLERTNQSTRRAAA